jgi:NADH-quinone oxidoreductase subunit G
MDNGLVMIQRGFRMEVGTAPDHAFDSVFSGNTTEICPVGALTATSYRFKARPWELKRVPSVCNNCSVGCNARVDVRVDRIMRLMSRNNDEVDDGWLCNRGRWGFGFVNNPDRLRTPLIRRNGSLAPASWDEALSYVATKLKDIAGTHGAQAVAGIGSTRTTNEETYLFQKLLRQALKTNNVDHHHGRFSGPRDTVTGKPWMMTSSLTDLEKAGHIVLVASDPYERQPILNLRLKKAMRGGTKITIINSEKTEMDRFEASDVYSVRKINIPQNGAGAAAQLLLKYALSHEGVGAGSKIEVPSAKDIEAAEQAFGSEITGQLQLVADELVSAGTAAKGAIILYDEMATLDPNCENLAADLQALAVVTNNIDRAGAGVGPLFEDANSLGARDMGLLPDALPGYGEASEKGLTYDEILSSPQVKALFVMGANPARHLVNGELPKTLEFVVVQDIMLTETAQQADVVLPAVTFAEKDGTMTNVDHHVQVIRRALRPLPGAKADWEILVALANRLGQNWIYASPRDIFAEIADSNPFYTGLTYEDLGLQGVRTQEQEVARA